MADQNLPNEASRKSKAEGERWTPDSEHAGTRQRSGSRQTDDAAGIINRPVDEEIENRGEQPMNRDERSSSNDPTSEPAARQSTQSVGGLSPGRKRDGDGRHAADEETVNRSHPNTTPRRYDQPLEDDEDRIMPADDSTLNTKI